MRVRIQRFCLLVALVVVLAGCSRSPRISYYLLTSDSSLLPAGSAAAAAPTVAIAAVLLPELADRPQLVVPGEGAQVQILESHRWAESLKAAVPRIMAENLSRLVGADRVAFHPQYAATRADYRIFVDLQRFEAGRTAVLVDALWTIKASTADARPVTRRSTISEPINGSGYEALAAAYSRALGKLSAELSRAIPQ